MDPTTQKIIIETLKAAFTGLIPIQPIKWS